MAEGSHRRRRKNGKWKKSESPTGKGLFLFCFVLFNKILSDKGLFNQAIFRTSQFSEKLTKDFVVKFCIDLMQWDRKLIFNPFAPEFCKRRRISRFFSQRIWFSGMPFLETRKGHQNPFSRIQSPKTQLQWRSKMFISKYFSRPKSLIIRSIGWKIQSNLPLLLFLVNDHFLSVTTFPKYHSFLNQITIAGTSSRGQPLVGNSNHFFGT